MINHVVLGGRIVKVDTEETPHGLPILVLRLVVEHVSWNGEYQEQCEVRAKLFGERRVAGLSPYLTEGRSVSLTGHMCEGDQGAEIVIDQVEFLGDGCTNRPLWVDPARAA